VSAALDLASASDVVVAYRAKSAAPASVEASATVRAVSMILLSAPVT
jgi:hypothetical protein